MTWTGTSVFSADSTGAAAGTGRIDFDNGLILKTSPYAIVLESKLGFKLFFKQIFFFFYLKNTFNLIILKE